VKQMLIAIALAAGLSFVSSTPASAAARNYDCSKPGNANKVACKGTTKSSMPKAAPATKAPAVTRTTTTATKTTTTTRNYDCTKAGNANKAACKTARAQTPTGKSAGAAKTTTTSKATTTDCTKWYNKARAMCRTATTSSPPRTTVAPAPKPVAASTGKPVAANENSNPAGATAQCKDGTYSHAKTHQGACSHHGGVAKWM
jgi:hypothetical protein